MAVEYDGQQSVKVRVGLVSEHLRRASDAPGDHLLIGALRGEHDTLFNHLNIRVPPDKDINRALIRVTVNFFLDAIAAEASLFLAENSIFSNSDTKILEKRIETIQNGAAMSFASFFNPHRGRLEDDYHPVDTSDAWQNAYRRVDPLNVHLSVSHKNRRSHCILICSGFIVEGDCDAPIIGRVEEKQQWVAFVTDHTPEWRLEVQTF
uniref:Uncharacterized protein n=1 Tax=Chromera velia CCMP2878 TaxID=1169474 RepID=A0A0G4HHA5_9ALVE|eukprot:Cvel_27458.t1-p1 / transcript=Cvel_27458.t1 / gene=Cvel_27458 / organism=Chromera_velia_CCMP2878 / gene_product=hypothetical protein / transcript_product=hypothetical protein / location=Cvel_scaffold3428:14080-14697(+) / protein_length=206 / sequence_SO=supercontig / SO=protein_coding / is_pseudo=false